MKSAPILTLFTLFALFSVTAIAQDAANGPSAVVSCGDRNQAAMAQSSAGHLAEAEASLAQLTAPGAGRDLGMCAGMVLSNMAGMMSVLGRIADAERLAEESVHILEEFCPADDWSLLRPLQILAAVRLESGKTARAREALKRIQSIRIRHPEDRAIVHTTLGALLQVEGRLAEAEAEYQQALRAWEATGRSDSADAAAILHCLGSLYLMGGRLDESRHVLDRALAIYDRAQDAVPADRIKLFNLRGVLYGRLGEWKRSERELSDAVRIIDGQPAVDPSIVRPILNNYAYVLRRNHHGKLARSIEARLRAMPEDLAAARVVDITDLRIERKAAKR